MPINFELTFTQPLLLDLMNAKFADTQDYANAITKYYKQTIETGWPMGIPPTMPSPAASGAPVPVGLAAADAFKAPFSSPKEKLFNEAVFTYFNLKDLVIANGSLAQKKEQLEGVLRKAEYQKKLIESKVILIKDIKKRVETAPADIKNTIEGIKVLFGVFMDQLKNVKADILGFSAAEVEIEGIDLKAEFANKFPAEAKIVDSLLNINFGKVQETINAIQTAQAYFNKVKANTQSFDSNQGGDYVKGKLTLIVAKISKLASGLLFPESLGVLILDLKKRGEVFDDKALKALNIAITASERLGFIKFILEPEIKKLEEFVKNKKRAIKRELDKGKVKIQEAIDKKAKEIAAKNAKKPSTEMSAKKKWFKKKADDINAFKKENEEFIKTTVKNIQTLTRIITKSTALVNSALSIKDDITEAVSGLKEDFERNKAAVVDLKDGLGDQAEFASAAKASVTNIDVTSPSIEIASNPRIKTKQQVTQYFNDHGAGEMLDVIVPLVTSLGLTFLDVKKVTEKTDAKFGLIIKQLMAMEAQYYDLENEAKSLEKLPPINRKSSGGGTDKEDKREDRKQRTPKPPPTKLKYNIMSVIAFLKKFTQKIEAFIKKQEAKVKRYLKKQELKLKALAEQIEIAIINSLPIPTEGESAVTKKEAAEEKKAIIAANVIKVKQTTAKLAAATLMGTSAAELVSNISNGKLGAADNEPLLKKISSAKFDFFTVGVDSASPAYKRQEFEKVVMDKEIATLHELDTYISIILVVAKDVKAKAEANAAEKKERLAQADELEARAGSLEDEDYISPAAKEKYRLELLNKAVSLRANQKLQGFVDRIKGDYESIVNAGEKGLTSPLIERLFTVLDSLFKEDADLKLDDVIKSTKELLIISQSSALSETLQSQSLVRVFRGIEKEYLGETNKALTKLLGLVPDDTSDEDSNLIVKPEASGGLTKSVQSIKRAKDEALARLGDTKVYRVILDLYRALNEGRGSVISILLAKMVELLEKFEAFVKKQVERVVAHIKKKINEKIDKNKAAHIEKLKLNVKKKVNLDLIGQSIAFNIAVALFWTGSSWQNTAGTMFQAITIPPFPPLKVNGVIDGQAKAIRELAKNLENQLPNLSGLCIPLPATGIPPFPFMGYK